MPRLVCHLVELSDSKCLVACWTCSYFSSQLHSVVDDVVVVVDVVVVFAKAAKAADDVVIIIINSSL